MFKRLEDVRSGGGMPSEKKNAAGGGGGDVEDQLVQIFREADIDGSGYLSTREFRQVS